MSWSGTILDILSAVIVIIAIFGLIYMLSNPLLGITIVFFCGILIFVRALIKKHS